MKLRILISWVCILYGLSFSQSYIWPDYFTIPAPDQDSLSDTNSCKFTDEISVFEQFQNRTKAEYRKENGDYAFVQSADYYLTRFSSQSLNQYINLSGGMLRKGLPFNGALGLDWTPVAFLNRRDSGSSIQSMLDLGPAVKFDMLGLPFKVRGGISGKAWNDNIYGSILNVQLNKYSGDPGFYGECDLGNPFQKLWGMPLVIDLNAFGRSMSGVGLGIMKGTALYAYDPGSGDSLFFCLGDSLSNGKEVYMAGVEGKPLYTETPWRICHSFSFAGALRGKKRFSLVPAVIYNYKIHSISYPSQVVSMDDEKITDNSLQLQIASEDLPVISYQGGLSFTWENENVLFGKHFGRIADSSNANLLSINQGDNLSLITAGDLEVDVRLPKDFLIKYNLHAFKDSKHYPFWYIESGDTITNPNENDRVEITNHLGIVYGHTEICTLETYGEYSRLNHYYYKKERSGESFNTDGYLLGLNAKVKLSRISVAELIEAEAEKNDYKFKEVHMNPFDPPPYSRKITSTLIGTLNCNEKLQFTGKWVETYNDNGKWYGKAYVDSLESGKNFKEFYAIENKVIDYSLEFYMNLNLKNFQVSFGNAFRDIFQRSYDWRINDYEIVNMGNGYIIKPSLVCGYNNEHFQLNGKVERMIDTFDKNKWSFDKNWDIHLLMGTQF